jgi:hypothetical protein
MTVLEGKDALRADIPSIVQRIGNDTVFLHELVALARDEGMSWEEIADFLGTTRQAAWQRFGR